MPLTILEEQALQRFLGDLKNHLGSNFLRATLFGSRARGEGNENSDIDVLVLLKKVSIDEKHQIWDLAADIFLDLEVEISPLVMSQERFEKLKNLERLLAKEIEQEGIPL